MKENVGQRAGGQRLLWSSTVTSGGVERVQGTLCTRRRTKLSRLVSSADVLLPSVNKSMNNSITQAYLLCSLKCVHDPYGQAACSSVIVEY